jgi:SAM-dependent methyltransferase
MMLGTRDLFSYNRCVDCGSLYLTTELEDPGQYYPKTYYSFQPTGQVHPLKTAVKRAVVRHRLGYESWIGAVLCRWLPDPMMVGWLKLSGVRLDSAILDVGCGDGVFLKEMSHYGFTSLTGSDPFIDNDMVTDRGVVIRKQYLNEIDGTYDLIMMHHSLEHVPNPSDTLQEAKKRLKPNGKILIRIPVAGSSAQMDYAENWVQWDAPRHIHIPTIAGMKALSNRLAMTVEAVHFDSDSFQYWGSELYRKGIPLNEFNGQVDPKRLDWVRKAIADNQNHTGDQACFVLSLNPN